MPAFLGEFKNWKCLEKKDMKRSKIGIMIFNLRERQIIVRKFNIFCVVFCLSTFISCSDSPLNGSSLDNSSNKQPNLENMVFIPAGEFLMGSSKGEGAYDEHPKHKVYLDAYYIDKYEVTNAQFMEFIRATGYITDAERRGRGEVWNPKENSPYLRLHSWADVNWRCPHVWRTSDNREHPKVWENYNIMEKMDCPVIQVSWNDAQAYAKWEGKRLPTEAEWEKAARGNDGRKWPWGNDFGADIQGVTLHACITGDEPQPVDSFPTGVSPYGVYNMAGNVQEWVADFYGEDYYAYSPKSNPKGPEEGKFRILKGGSWRHQKSHLVLSARRDYQEPNYCSNFVGFRCVWSGSIPGQNGNQ